MKTWWMLLFIPSLAFSQNDAYPKSDASLVFWAPLDGSGNDSIYSLATTTNGSPAVSSNAKSGTSISFNGTTYFSYGDPADGHLDFGTGPFTMSAWVYTTSPNGIGVVALKCDQVGGATQPGYVFDVEGSIGSKVAQLKCKGTSTEHAMYSTGIIPDNTWMLVVVTRKNVGGDIYINTQLNSASYSPDKNLQTENVNNSFEFRIAYDLNAARLWIGLIDNIMVWNRVVSPNEIEQLYAGRWRLTVGELSSIRQGQGLGIGD